MSSATPESNATTSSTSTAELERVGFIGLGSQGGPMAARIADSAFPLTLWARRSDSLRPYSGKATSAATPAELGRASDLVCICVVDDAGVEAVVLGDDGVLAGMAPGGAIAIHSTVRPETCERIARAAAVVGVDVIDAPVSGGGSAAEENALLVMAGGAGAVVDRFRPVFGTFADPVVHLGPLGAGQVTKLLNNTMFTANLATAADLMAVGRDLGVDPARLSEVVARGSGASFAMNILGYKAGDLAQMADTAGPLLHKDVSILAEVLKGRHPAIGPVWDAADAALRTMRHPRNLERNR